MRALVPFENCGNPNECITPHQVELLQWFVAEGQSIKAFDRICEVQSDKATVEISSRYDGKVRCNSYSLPQLLPQLILSSLLDQVLKLCHAKNAIAKVGAPLMVIEVADDVAEAPGSHAGGDGHGAAASAPALPQEAATQMMNADGSILTTPAVRRLAREHQVDLSKVHGSGRDGRIMKDDVRLHIFDVVNSLFCSLRAAESIADCRTSDNRFLPGSCCHRTI